VPLALALARLDGVERWTQDVGVVRALDLVQIGGEGVLSGALASALALVPIGTTLLRLSLLSSLMVALGGYAVFRLAWVLLEDRVSAPARALLSLCGALIAGLSGAWQAAAVVVGGPSMGAVLALAWLLQLRLDGSSIRVWMIRGGLLALLLLESRALGIAALVPLTFRCVLRTELPGLRQMLLALGFAVSVVIVGLLPALIETRVTGFSLGLDLGAPPDRQGVEPLDLVRDLGFYLLALAVAGAVVSLDRARGRLAALPALGFVALALVWPSRELHLVSVGVLGATSSLGFAFAVRALSRSRIRFARMTVQVVAFTHLCAVLLLFEGAAQDARQRTMSATREWSEQAFERLPARSMLLVSSPEAAWRLWAARLTSGIRPDVVVVPAALLQRGPLAAELLELEPRLGALIRDVAVQGVPGEYSLAELADARPLRVEVDPRWDKPLLRHLMADGLWFRFAPHATGRTDRGIAQRSVRRTAHYVFGAAMTREGRDPYTVARTLEDLYRQAAVSVVLGDRRDAEGLLKLLRRFGVDEERLHPLVRGVSGESKDNPLDLLSASLSP
jgi:hypothetical protein